METQYQYLGHPQNNRNGIPEKNSLGRIQSFFAYKIQGIIAIMDQMVVSKYGRYIPAFICASSIGISAQLLKMEYDSTVHEITKQLDMQLLEITYPIQARIRTYEQLLNGVHGLFDSSNNVDRGGFKKYVQSLKLSKNFPEIPGVSASFYLKGEQLEPHIKSVQQEGFLNYGKNIHPGKKEYAPVVYIEPFIGNNISVLGFDNFGDFTRRELFLHAQRKFEPALSHPISLQQDSDKKKNNFLLTYPIYKRNLPHTTEKEREENIFGWATLVFRMDELIQQTSQIPGSHQALNIYDGTHEIPENLLFSSFSGENVESKFKIKRTKTISILNREWTFAIYSSKSQERTIYHQGYVENIFYSGMGITFLLTLLSYGFIRMRLEALDLLNKQQKSIQDLEHMGQEMKHLAIHDSLTHLSNRVGFMEKLTGLISLSNRNESKVALMFVDLDEFKNVNDNYGHHIGDKLLIAVTQRMKHILRGEDIIGRQGGDEFFVAIGNFKDIETASMVATKIIQALKSPFLIEGHEIHIGSSIGISVFPDDSKDINVLQQYADLAMYSVKESGRNGYHFYTQSMQRDAEEYNRITNALRCAIEKKEFSMVYQPVVDTKSGEIASLEALIRWENPELGNVSPAKFIPIAENDVNTIENIGKWTLERVCRQINTWKQQGISVPRVAVNLSAKQFLNSTFEADILAILESMNIHPTQIGLEITEGVLFKDINSAIVTINRLSQLGFVILIDDFGTGYSNLHYISKFSAGIIKIDRSFIATMDKEENKQIITLIITLAHSLGMKVIAEGVEEAFQYEYLQKLDCDYIQGYYCGRPGKAEELIQKLEKKA